MTEMSQKKTTAIQGLHVSKKCGRCDGFDIIILYKGKDEQNRSLIF